MTSQVAARVGEAVRLAAKVKGNQSYVLPYGTVWTTYHYPNGTNPSNFLEPGFLDVQVDLCHTFQSHSDCCLTDCVD
jgi:hypothetical protein